LGLSNINQAILLSDISYSKIEQDLMVIAYPKVIT